MYNTIDEEDECGLVIVDHTKDGKKETVAEGNNKKTEINTEPLSKTETPSVGVEVNEEKPKRRGRGKSVPDFALTIPEGEFTINQLKAANVEADPMGAITYLKLLGAISHGKVKLVRTGRIANKPGRPTNIYQKIS